MRAMAKLTQRGSLHLGIVAVVVALTIVGFVGYKVATSNKKTADTTTTSSQKSSASTSSGSYTSKEDVAKDDNSLNTSDVDQELNTTQLDSDINNLL